jgi:hypothetical protein
MIEMDLFLYVDKYQRKNDAVMLKIKKTGAF